MPPGAGYWTPLGRAERGRAGVLLSVRRPSKRENRQVLSYFDCFVRYCTVTSKAVSNEVPGSRQVGKAGKREVEHLIGYLEGPYRRCSELVESGSSWRELKAACACEMLMMTSYVDSGMAVCTPFVHTKL
ncbi:hypothetical protein CISG_06608 [Coccidioides immitis RMSCC 3703]|uniref:Uncharacterized protein n=1 Tax=Coccidioides immitis RMSCC 3703 TaxID=454286 RepID=A0A0J8QY18_COCIT|nr:hypothetical protein CISG_06608 [Coccidioides immitis RMSCC 3703]